jgi:hypothetical protein
LAANQDAGRTITASSKNDTRAAILNKPRPNGNT